MADDMDSDTCVGFKRTIKDSEETQTLPQRSDSPSAIPEQDSHSSEIVSPLKQDADFIDKSSPCLVSESSKKDKSSPHGQVSETHLEELQEIPNSANEKLVSLGFVSGFPASDGVAQDFMGNCEVGLVSDGEFVTTETAKTLDDEKKGEGEVGFSGIQKLMQETESATESFEKAAESQSSLEAKKKQLLEEVEAMLAPAEKAQVKTAADGSVGSFRIEVIDDTALMILPGNGRGKELGCAQRNGNKNAKQEMNGKKARAAARKERVANRLVEARSLSLEKEKGTKIIYSRKELEAMRFVDVGEKEKVAHCLVEASSLSFEKGKGTKISYSRKELEAMRYVNVVEQKKLWKDIYSGLGPVVAKEYDDMASAKQQKNTHNNFEHRKRFEKMEAGPGILGESFSENVDIELENLMNNETQDASALDPFCSYSATDEDGHPFQEKECTEDYDSDEDYASIQRPAFAVDGEPNFESGSPEDGLEYLRRVRWEAAQIPKVKIAKVDRSKFNKEQSAYMPKIPEIAKCPEQFMPLKQWEDAFLAEFSELRLALSGFEGSHASTSRGPQSNIILHGKFEKLLNVESQEVDFHWLQDRSIFGSSTDQPSLSINSGNNASLPAENSSPKLCVTQSSSDTPLLSVILKMDSVARVSMLRKRIKAVEDMTTLSRNDCLWLFALCAVVDTPLDADTSASLRSLLRKCAALRAAKSTLDDEAVMLNILATISGRYFGQSEN
ncbi:hypothetical protein ACFX2F_032031 [Malus domestica]